jgi:hypothetical protein
MGGIMNERQEEIADLKRRIEALEKEEVETWEPEGGEWFSNSYGKVECFKSIDSSRLFGLERTTKEQTEKARDKMRVYNRLLAYHDEFCPDYEFTNEKKNYYVFFSESNNQYMTDRMVNHRIIGCVFFPSQVAIELCYKLNSGEVVL